MSDARDGPAAPDQGQFGRCLLPHLDDAYRYARYLSRDQSAAEDIVQDAFLRALKAHASCHGNEKAWLFAIVRNCFIDWGKANRFGSTPDTGHLAETVADRDTPETVLERQLDALSVREAIARLPEPFREAIILRELDALSYREIATITGVPIGTVMSRLARARLLLSALLLSGDRKGMRA
ncbi:sigma-70 family RNA polymerase sigma factor [Sphingomonas sp. GlSt437]|uniref:sigma-70 family RNA polymerase sigma factor n=1 Tax=Sphingomonas sp. GlSt437 TaxID=3389970 RepID=UPI003EB93581